MVADICIGGYLDVNTLLKAFCSILYIFLLP